MNVSVGIGQVFTPQIALDKGFTVYRANRVASTAKAYIVYTIDGTFLEEHTVFYVVTFQHVAVCITTLQFVVDYILRGIRKGKGNEENS